MKNTHTDMAKPVGEVHNFLKTEQIRENIRSTGLNDTEHFHKNLVKK